MFSKLESINSRPEPFEYYTAAELWTDEHTSKQMLAFHLNGDIDVSSRNTAFIDRSTSWIASRFGLGPGKSVADFGCGPGLYAARLAQTGAQVTGIDFSPRSVQYARDAAAQAGAEIEYEHANYLEYETEKRFDLVLMIMCDFCALSPQQRGTMLAKFGALLKPGGSILLDVYSMQAYAQREETAMYERGLLGGFWSPNPYFGFLNTFKYDDANVVLDKYTIVEPESEKTVYNWLQYFCPRALGTELQACGLQLADQFANVAGDPYDPQAMEFAVVAQKA